MELVELAPRAEPVRDPVGQRLRRVRVEGADHRGVTEGARIPAYDRRLRRVDVHDVEAARPQLAAHRVHAVVEDGEVGDCPIGAEANGPTQGHEVVGARSLLGGAAMKHAGEAIGRIPRRHNAHLMPTSEQRLGQRLDVAVDATSVGPRVWADDCDAHWSGRWTPLSKGPAWGRVAKRPQVTGPAGLQTGGEWRSSCVAQATPTVAAHSTAPIIRSSAPESLARVPASVAATAPRSPAHAARRAPNQPSIRRHRATPATIRAITIQKTTFCA